MASNWNYQRGALCVDRNRKRYVKIRNEKKVYFSNQNRFSKNQHYHRIWFEQTFLLFIGRRISMEGNSVNKRRGKGDRYLSIKIH